MVFLKHRRIAMLWCYDTLVSELKHMRFPHMPRELHTRGFLTISR